MREYKLSPDPVWHLTIHHDEGPVPADEVFVFYSL